MIPKRIINHHSLTKDSGSVSWGAIRNWHMGITGGEENYYTKHPMIDIGYHFGLEMIGDHCEILVGRMMNEQGAHTKGQNRDSIGICWVGNFDKDEVHPEMWNLGVRFVASLCETLHIEPDETYGHCDFSTKSCPGNRFNVASFKMQVLDKINS